MLQLFSRISMALVAAAAFQMTAWAGENARAKPLPRLVIEAAFQENVPLNQLPKLVTDAIKNRFPKSQMMEAEKDLENGKIVKYEVKVRNDNKNYEVEVTPTGKIIKVELSND
jgi:hypothetical protein